MMHIFSASHCPFAGITMVYCTQDRQITLFRIGKRKKLPRESVPKNSMGIDAKLKELCIKNDE